jgi:hypothetical protein
MPPFEQNAVYLQSGDPRKENTPTLYAPGLLGARFTVTGPASRAQGAPPPTTTRHQLVKSDSTMTVGPYPGATAYWADRTNYLVTTVNTNLNAVAGIFNCLVDKGNYCCVQFDGPGYTKVLDADMATLVPGDYVIGSGTAGKATRSAAGSAPASQPLGIVSTPLARLATEARILVELNLPEAP